jgi:acetyl esterase/lipase
MTSWQAYLAAWILRQRLKPKLRAAQSIAETRRLLTPPEYHIPKSVRVRPDRIGGIPGEWIEGSAAGDVLLLYLHGGGYIACSIETHRAITVAFAQQGFRVYAPEYRLAPEHPFPAALDDANAVYECLLPKRPMVIAGDSAGGGLALALMLRLRDANIPLPSAGALFSPWTDLAGTGPSLKENNRRCAMFYGESVESGARHYLGDTDACHPLASPLYADLSHLPPLLIHVGRDEVLRDDSTRLAERARAAGVSVDLQIWPVVPHAWQLAQTTLPEARQSLREAAAFLHAKANLKCQPA